MSSRWIPAFALMAVVAVSASGCTIRTGEAARDSRSQNRPPPPPAPKKAATKKSTPKKSEPKRSEPKKEVERVIVDRTPEDPDYRATSGAATPASDDDKVKWEKLGEGTANGKNDHDVIQVGRAEGKFSKIRFRVTNSDVKIHNVVIHFVDGSKHSPSTRVDFKEGQMSNVIDLPGSRRAIKSVNFRYSDSKGSGNAQVEVWGRN